MITHNLRYLPLLSCPVPDTNSTNLSNIGTPFVASTLYLSTCLTQTRPCTTLSLHTSWLQLYLFFRFAPCLVQTLLSINQHPSWLQILTITFAPCLTQIPHIPVLDQFDTTFMAKFPSITLCPMHPTDFCFLCFVSTTPIIMTAFVYSSHL